MISELGSRSKGRPILDGNGVKAKPGSIHIPNPGLFNKLNERKYRWSTPPQKNLPSLKIVTNRMLQAGIYLTNCAGNASSKMLTQQLKEVCCCYFILTDTR